VDECTIRLPILHKDTRVSWVVSTSERELKLNILMS